MLRGFTRYLRRYAHVALAPLQLKMQLPSGEFAPVDAAQVAAMKDETLAGLIAKVFRPGRINIQKYIADQGGYPYWHSEQYPKHDQGEALHRALLWTIYLNDEFEEGETEFLYQQRKISPRTGSLLIAPGGFTHTHRGQQAQGREQVHRDELGVVSAGGSPIRQGLTLEMTSTGPGRPGWLGWRGVSTPLTSPKCSTG